MLLSLLLTLLLLLLAFEPILHKGNALLDELNVVVPRGGLVKERLFHAHGERLEFGLILALRPCPSANDLNAIYNHHEFRRPTTEMTPQQR